jgi:iron complex outermembrane receptor protein
MALLPEFKYRAFIGVLLVWTSAATRAAVEGVVSTATHLPIEHVQVEVEANGRATFTGREGEFQFADLEPPLVLRFSHPRFQTRLVDLAVGDSMPLAVALEFKQEIYDEIAVTAAPGEKNLAPISIAATVIDPGDAVSPPSSLTELVAAAPAVSENGQGGLFQTFSIRGVSRQRVMTLVSGARIVGERRAGVSASFLDPQLMRSVEVLRGSATTFYGSGALGGAVQVFPREFDGWTMEAGYLSQGDENHQVVGWGDAGWSLGVARRHAAVSETPAGDPLNTGFSQVSGLLGRRWSPGELEYEIQAIASDGADIGKSNTDFPERTTVYPDEKHLLLRFAVGSDSDWLLEAWTHPNTLDTEVRQSDALDEVENEALDFGVNWQKQVRIDGTVSSRFGLDYVGRRGVDALERSTDLGSGAVIEQRTLDGGEDNELGIYGATEWNVGPAVVLAGARYTYENQQNASQPSTSDTALTGFAGLVVPLGAGLELASNLGTGLRFPSLSERYFTGATGRGNVIANPNLDAEGSVNVDLGLRWYGQKLFVSGFLSRNEIDDYIERSEVAPDVLSFVNLVSGTITGFEYNGFYQFDQSWSLDFGGHQFEGRSDLDETLADIPPNRFALGGTWRRGPWVAQLRWEQRSAIDDPGPSEKPIPDASLVSAAVEYAFDDGLVVSLAVRNLLDEEYFNAADEKMALAPGAGFGLAVRWQPRAALNERASRRRPFDYVSSALHKAKCSDGSVIDAASNDDYCEAGKLIDSPRVNSALAPTYGTYVQEIGM